jgi:hypothetical protein
VTTPGFTPFPKLARLNRDITITEKLDGTNAAVVIVEMQWGAAIVTDHNRIAITLGSETPELDEYGVPLHEYHVYAQSRSRFITPGKSTDNYGFAGWVKGNAAALVEILGPGTHFGEWWGAGIQRGYGLTGNDKRFSLFNTGRWDATEFEFGGLHGGRIPGLSVVPTLYAGPFSQRAIEGAMLGLRVIGSHAAPGFLAPEGIVIYHEAARQSFKVTLEGDDAPKQTPRRAEDLLPAHYTEAVAA